MAQSTILVQGATEGAASTDVVIAAGTTVTVGMFASGGLDSSAFCYIYMKTPQADVLIGSLRPARPVKTIAGPGTVKIVRKSGNIGIFLDA